MRNRIQKLISAALISSILVSSIPLSAYGYTILDHTAPGSISDGSSFVAEPGSNFELTAEKPLLHEKEYVALNTYDLSLRGSVKPDTDYEAAMTEAHVNSSLSDSLLQPFTSKDDETAVTGKTAASESREEDAEGESAKEDSIEGELVEEAVSSEPMQAGSTLADGTYTISGTKLSFTLSGTSVTFSGSGTIPQGWIAAYNNTIKTITVGDSAVIGEAAFAGFTQLTKVTISSSGTYIGKNAFNNCTALTSISIPNTITVIRDGAFAYCSKLSSVKMTSSTKTIGKQAFLKCAKLTTVSMPGVQTLGMGAFAYCSSLATLSMPNTLTKTGGDTFNRCSNLTSVTLSSSLTAISEYDFYLCEKLSSVTIPASVKSIGEGAFYGCSGMTAVTFPDSYVTVGSYCFSFCNSLEPSDQIVKLENVGKEAFFGTNLLRFIEFSPQSEGIDDKAFVNNAGLETINFNNAEMKICDYAFENCAALTSFSNLPTLKYVGEAAFKNCSILTSIKISETCEQILPGAFYYCENLQSIDFGGARAEIGHRAFAGCSSLKTITGQQNIVKLDEYCLGYCNALTVFSGFDALSLIGNGVFYGCEGLKTVSLPDTVTVIPDYTFFSCPVLEEVSLPSELNRIGGFSFTLCSSLQEISIPESVTVIGEGAFAECDAITSAAIPSSVSRIENFTFAQCDHLQNVSGGSGVNSIGERAFSFCPKLKNTAFTSSLQTLDSTAFYGCESLKGIGATTGIVSIGDRAFYGCETLESFDAPNAARAREYAFTYCKGLTSVSLPNLEEPLGNCAFWGCESLVSAQIGGTLDYIGEESFCNCTGLTDLTLSGQIAGIGDCAFYGCESLTSIALPEQLETIGKGAFYNCSGLTAAEIPDGVSKVGQSSFYGCSSLSSAHLPESLEIIEDALFFKCGALASVNLPEGVSYIGYASFYECGALETISIPGSVEQIDDFAFGSCTKLSGITLPKGLISLGDAAFANCEDLTSIILPRGLTTIGNGQFYQCTSLTDVQFMGTIVGIGTLAFKDCTSLSGLQFGGGVPLVIGEDAFDNIPDTMLIKYSAFYEGWSSPEWEGPDGNSYNTKELEADTSGTIGTVNWKYYAGPGALVVSGNGDMMDYQTEFDLPWFNFRTEITSVRIEDGVTSIGARAFAECTALRSVSMPDSLTKIGDYAFSGCGDLTYIRLSSALQSIGEYAFYGCVELAELLFPATLTDIGEYAFFGCRGLSSVSLPDSVISLGEGAFYRCAGLKDVLLSLEITDIADYTFRGCSSLQTVIAAGEISSIGKYAFANCGKLSSIFVFGQKAAIRESAFYGCELLESLYFDGLPESAGRNAFRKMSEDATIYLVDGNGGNADFSDDSGYSLSCKAASSDQEGECGDSVSWKFFKTPGVLYVYGEGEMRDFDEGESPWDSVSGSIRSVIVGSGITSIGSNAFRDCRRLKQASLPESLQAVGECAFADCTGLQNIKLADSITEMGSSAFYHCRSLSEVHLPEKLTAIPDYAFALCENLRSVSLGSKVKSIGYSSFYDCEALSFVKIQSVLTQVGAWAFARCGNLNSVEGSQNIHQLGDHAFFSCESLSSCSLSDQLTEIPAFAFAGTAISVVSIPASVRTIGERAFWGGSLQELELGNVSEIGTAAFYDTKLTQVTIPASVTRVESYAFGKCRELMEIVVAASSSSFRSEGGILCSADGKTLLQYPCGKKEGSVQAPDGIKTIGTGAFYSCSFSEIILPATVATIGEAAFCECNGLKDVVFKGNAPQTIGQGAFAGVNTSLVFHYIFTASGWREGEWTGPDGNVYSTVTTHSSAIRLIRQFFSSQDGEIWVDLVIDEDSYPEDGAILYAAAYAPDGQLLTAASRKMPSYAGASCPMGFCVYGGSVRKGETQFKVFLLSKDHTPLLPELAITSNYTLDSDKDCGIEVREDSGSGLPAVDPVFDEIDDIEPSEQSDPEGSGDNGNGQGSSEPSEQPDPEEPGGSENEQGLTGDGRLSVRIGMDETAFRGLLSSVETGKVSGVGLSVQTVSGDAQEEEELSSDINIPEFDSHIGYQPNGIAITGSYVEGDADSAAEPWMPSEYAHVQISARTRTFFNKSSGEVTKAVVNTDAASFYRSADLYFDSAKLLSVRPVSYAGLPENASFEHVDDDRYALLLPYGSMSAMYEFDAGQLAGMLPETEAVKKLVGNGTIGEQDGTREFVISFFVSNDEEEENDLFRIKIATEAEDGSVSDVELVEAGQLSVDVPNLDYEALIPDEDTEGTDEEELSVLAVSPNKGGTGDVTVKISGKAMDAGVKAALKKGNTEYAATAQYYYGENKLYATFNLSKAANGDYDLVLRQRDEEVTLTKSFKVNSSLKKGTLKRTVNISKKAQKSKEYNGSITFTNTGYTDVYAPVIYLDAGNMNLKEKSGGQAFKNRTVFVANKEGLPGIIANGETASYSFKYSPTNKDYALNLYDYASARNNLKSVSKPGNNSSPSDYLLYNVYQITGARACDWAVSIAKAACVLSALGDNNYDIEYLRNAYLPNAQGTLIGSTLSSTTDIASRDLSLSRYYYTDVSAHQKEGLFGKGWFSEYDVTAQKKDDVITISAPNGMAVYTEQDGVYREAIYGDNTAEVSGEEIIVKDRNGNTIRFNSSGRIMQLTDNYGNYVSLSYGIDGRPEEISNSYGDSLLLSYDDGLLSDITSSVTGEHVRYIHKNGLLTAFVGKYGAVYYEYDEADKDCRRHVLTSISADDRMREEFSYDQYGRIIMVSNGEYCVRYSYPGMNVVEAADSNGDSVRTYFNAAGQAVRTIDADGEVLEKGLTDRLLIDQISSGTFGSVSMEYDDSFNVTKITDPAGLSTQFAYDTRGNMTEVTDRGGLAVSYERNDKGDVQKITYEDGKYEAYAYDEKGNVTAVTRRDGTTVNYSYDEYAQLTKAEYPDGEYIAYDYDEAGNVVRVIEFYDDAPHVTSLGYSAKGDLAFVQYRNPEERLVSYDYDERGNLTQITIDNLRYTVNYMYEYDAMNRLTNVYLGESKSILATAYQYNPDGSLKKQTNYNGTYTDYAYSHGRLASIRNYGEDGQVLSFFEYEYDKSGNIISMKEKAGTWTYSYDKVGQLVRAVSPNGKTTVYSYDASGNRTEVTNAGTMTSYNSNEMNQYTKYGSVSCTYDANGNLLTRKNASGTTKYYYDYRNRLAQVDEPGGRTVYYQYDAFGSRSALGIQEAGAETINQVQYVNSPLGEGDTLLTYQDGLWSYYMPGLGLAARWDYNSEDESNQLYAYHYNHLGSVTEITDEEGVVVNSYVYNQEGKVTSSVEPGNNSGSGSAIKNPYTYAGRYGLINDGNGLIYDRARYISADTMSFTQMDPAGQYSDLNLYRYANNNPIGFIDVSGQDAAIAAALPRTLMYGTAIAGIAGGANAVIPFLAAAAPYVAVVALVGTLYYINKKNEEPKGVMFSGFGISPISGISNYYNKKYNNNNPKGGGQTETYITILSTLESKAVKSQTSLIKYLISKFKRVLGLKTVPIVLSLKLTGDKSYGIDRLGNTELNTASSKAMKGRSADSSVIVKTSTTQTKPAPANTTPSNPQTVNINGREIPVEAFRALFAGYVDIYSNMMKDFNMNGVSNSNNRTIDTKSVSAKINEAIDISSTRDTSLNENVENYRVFQLSAEYNVIRSR